MTLHLAEIANEVAPGAHAVVLADQAGWHIAGGRAAPERGGQIPGQERSQEGGDGADEEKLHPPRSGHRS